MRTTEADLSDGASLVIHEKIMTHGEQTAETNFTVDLNGVDSSANVISRSVAKEHSKQVFNSHINGNNKCYGHTECDAIIMDAGRVEAIPSLAANHIDASLIHEAAIGKIAGRSADQADDARTDGEGSRGADRKRILKIKTGFTKPVKPQECADGRKSFSPSLRVFLLRSEYGRSG